MRGLDLVDLASSFVVERPDHVLVLPSNKMLRCPQKITLPTAREIGHAQHRDAAMLKGQMGFRQRAVSISCLCEDGTIMGDVRESIPEGCVRADQLLRQESFDLFRRHVGRRKDRAVPESGKHKL